MTAQGADAVVSARSVRAIAAALLVLLALLELSIFAVVVLVWPLDHPHGFFATLAARSPVPRALGFLLLAAALVGPLAALCFGKGRRALLRAARSLRGDAPSPALRLSGFVLALTFVSIELAYHLAARALAAIAADHHPPPVYVGYEEPWRSVAFGIALALAAVPAMALARRRASMLAVLAASFGALAASLVFAAELSTHVVIGEHTGELSVEFPLRKRSVLRFSTTSDGPCLQIEFDSIVRWTVNGAPLIVSWLPLPRDTRAVQAVLSRALPNDSPDCP